MRKVYVVGTVHNMLPKYEADLRSVIENINPDQLLVEITDKDLKQKEFRHYPKEMAYAYRWAVKNNRQLAGFDFQINVDKKSVTKKAAKEYEKKLYEVVANLDWKELNKPEYDDHEKINDILSKLVDVRRHKSRQKKMLKNIFKVMNDSGVVLILTGAGHLKYFEENIKNAIFPLRHVNN